MFKPYDTKMIAYARRETLLREAAAARLARQAAEGQRSTSGCLARALHAVAMCLEARRPAESAAP